jgi:hypothetical protein
MMHGTADAIFGYALMLVGGLGFCFTKEHTATQFMILLAVGAVVLVGLHP